MQMILSLRLSNLSEYISQKKLLSQNARAFVCPMFLLYFDYKAYFDLEVATGQLSTVRQSYVFG